MDQRDDQNMQLYLHEIGQVELLAPEEEIELAARVKKGDEEARQRMIRANLRLVVHIATEYAKLGLPLLDLISEGNIGLMKAVDRFDPAKGGKLSTYAAWWIKQGIRRALSNQGKTVRLPSHLVEKLFRFRREEEAMTKELGRAPTIAELAARMEVEERVIRNWRRVSLQSVSLDQPFGPDNDHVLGDSLKTEASDPSETLEHSQLKDEMLRYLGQLDAREQLVLTQRFGLDGAPPKTLDEVGEEIGVTRERVRQIQNRALERLRDELLKE